MYEKYLKRALDFIVALLSLIILSPILLILSIVGAIVLRGNPFFIQPRPGKKGKDGKEDIFSLIKFRSMSNARGHDGKLLPDEQRLGKYGKFIRSTSLDELPSLINILKGDLSLCGPRPQLVRDMVFMTDEQRRRHDVRPGLTGLAQINGRNNITWEKKFEYDLQYIKNITFLGDMKIILLTAIKVFKRENITQENMATAEDLGDYLLRIGAINEDFYQEKQVEAQELLARGSNG